MTSLRSPISVSILALLVAAGCSEPTGGGPGVDANTGVDGGARDAMGGECSLDGACPDAFTADSGAGDVDSGAGDVDSGAGDVDSGGTDIDGGISCAGMDCVTWAAALAAAPRDATSLDNCAIHLHRADCCGATDALGINHGARTTLCPAEATCVAAYPDPICSDMTITTDTGETTTVMDDVRLRITSAGVCETFVCTSGMCRSAPGVTGGCGP